MLRTRLVTFAVCGAALCAAIGCNDGASSRPEIQSSPVENGGKPADTQSEPAETKPSEKPDVKPDAASPVAKSDDPTKTGESSKDESDQQPKLPDYLTILERIDARAAVRVTEQKAARPRLVLDTRNVRRLRINRSKLSFARGRSIPLRIDGQVFEMRASSDVVELERSRNGEWFSPKKIP